MSTNSCQCPEYPGSWRTLHPYPNAGDWELYDIENDMTETTDLSENW